MLYLGGGGSAKDEAEVFAAAFKSVEIKTVAVWPWAQPEPQWEGLKTWITESLRDIGLSPTITVPRAPTFGLDDADIVVVPGGNTFSLLSHLQQHDLIPRLKTYLDHGGRYYGGSAGAVLAGADVGIIDSAMGGMDPDEIKLENRRGLDLLNGWVVYPHYEPQWREHCENWSMNGARVLGIPERGGLQIDHSTGHAVNLGPDDITMFEQGKITIWGPRAEKGLSRRSYVPPEITFGPVPGAAPIRDDNYRRLTSLLPTILQNSNTITTHSWELGLFIEAIHETYYPTIASFNYEPTSTMGGIPWQSLKVVLETLADYNWQGCPSSVGQSSSDLSAYLDTSTSPTLLRRQALVNGDGSLGDPCAVGPGTWILAQFLTREEVRKALDIGTRTADDYAWAVGNQLQYLLAGFKSENGTISQRDNKFELWSDMGYMIPPFLGYLGQTTQNEKLLSLALEQWLFESSILLDTDHNLFRHIDDWDLKLWATGNAWMIYGLCRVLVGIKRAGGSLWKGDQVKQAKNQLPAIFTALFSRLDKESLIPNYMDQSDPKLSVGDASATALVAAAYYRFALLAPELATDDLLAGANKAFNGAMAKLGDDGWLDQVVDPMGTHGWIVYPGSGQRSPEGQSFLAHMWAARTAFGS